MVVSQIYDSFVSFLTQLDKARYFTKGTTGWTHIEDFITCRIDAE